MNAISHINDCRLLNPSEWRIANGLSNFIFTTTVVEELEYRLYAARFCRAMLFAETEAKFERDHAAWKATPEDERKTREPWRSESRYAISPNMLSCYDVAISQCRVALAALYAKLED